MVNLGRFGATVVAAVLIFICMQSGGWATTSSVNLNFNATGIPAGETIWFNSVLDPSYSGGLPVTIFIQSSSLVLTKPSNPTYTINLPDMQITYSSAVTEPSLTYDSVNNIWIQQVPWGVSGNTFMDGIGFVVPAGQNLENYDGLWTADFSSDQSGVSVNWKSAAAAYTSFSSDPNTLDVKPTDQAFTVAGHSWNNSNHAGTPEAYKSYVVGGATGGGGSNFTGSYSGTASVDLEVVPEPATVGVALSCLLPAIPLIKKRRIANQSADSG